MSLAIALTDNQQRIIDAERCASQLLRNARNVIPAAVYSDLQVQLCIMASEGEKLRVNLGALRMLGELDQQPPPVTADRLELASCVPMVPRHALRDESAAFALELEHIGDDTLTEEAVR